MIAKQDYSEGDLVLCTVDSIEGTTVFVHLPDGEKGAIVTSEIAAGRIRNIRDFVVPKKKIVCKVLRVSGGNIDLSLRRVSSKEEKEVMTKYKQEKTSEAAMKQILKEEFDAVEKKILNDFLSLFEFLTEAREDEKLIEKYVPNKFYNLIKKLTEKKQKDVRVKEIFYLKCFESDGILKLKKILKIDDEKIIIIYLSAGKFQLEAIAEDYKKANHKMEETLEDLEKKAKENKCEFSVEEK